VILKIYFVGEIIAKDSLFSHFSFLFRNCFHELLSFGILE